MGKFFGFVKKVWKNEDEIFNVQRQQLVGCIGSFGIVTILALLLLLPIGRFLLKWIAYILTSYAIAFLIFMTIMAYMNFMKAYKHHKKLEKCGVTEEEIERSRRTLCENEGDDGFAPDCSGSVERVIDNVTFEEKSEQHVTSHAVSEEDSEKPEVSNDASTSANEQKPEFELLKNYVYFLDATAMAKYANKLYGCFIAQHVDLSYMKLSRDAVIYTTKRELQKLRDSESFKKNDDAPYPGYTGYVRSFVKLVPEISRDQLLCRRDDESSDTPTTDDEMNIALAVYLESLGVGKVVMISESDEVYELAKYNEIDVFHPFENT